MTFPASPVLNDLHTEPNGLIYKYIGNNIWEILASNYMTKTIYDPENMTADAFNRLNHVNQLSVAEINNLEYRLNLLETVGPSQNYIVPSVSILESAGSNLVININGGFYIHNLIQDINLQAVFNSEKPCLCVIHFVQPETGLTFTAAKNETWLVGDWNYSLNEGVINEVVLYAPVNGKVLATCSYLE